MSESKKKPTQSVPTWEFTIYGDIDKELEWLNSLNKEIKRGKAALETCPTTGREHLQGRITFYATHRFGYLKKFHPKARWEASKATNDWTYMNKRGEPPVWDVDNRAPGVRSDLDELKVMVQEGKTELECFEAHFGTMVRYGRGLERYRTLLEAKRKRPQNETIVYVGASGVSKTTTVEDRFPDAFWLTYDGKGSLWWDGYDGQKVVVFDDFRGSWMPYESLLQILNWNGKCRVNTKGGSKWLLAETFVFTCTEHPRTWYKEWDTQLERRLHTIIDLDTVVEHDDDMFDTPYT